MRLRLERLPESTPWRCQRVFWVPEGSLAGDFRAGFPWPDPTPRDPPRPPRPAPHSLKTSAPQTNARQFRGTQELPPDCFRYPGSVSEDALN